jgi:hypothetical protein
MCTWYAGTEGFMYAAAAERTAAGGLYGLSTKLLRVLERQHVSEIQSWRLEIFSESCSFLAKTLVMD